MTSNAEGSPARSRNPESASTSRNPPAAVDRGSLPPRSSHHPRVVTGIARSATPCGMTSIDARRAAMAARREPAIADAIQQGQRRQSPASAYSTRMSPFQIRQQMYRSDRQQHHQPPHQQGEAARLIGQPIELNGKTDAEQKREQRQRLQLDRGRQKGIERAVGGGSRRSRRQELREDGDAKLEHSVDDEHTEQRDAARRMSMPSIRSDGVTGPEAAIGLPPAAPPVAEYPCRFSSADGRAS